MNNPVDLVRQYLQFRKGREGLQRNEDSIKKSLMDLLAAEGESDDKGNRVFDLPESIDGIRGVKRERRVSQVMNEELALELIKKYGLEDTCLQTITVINEDGILAANFSGDIPDSDISDLYSEKESFAFVLLKDK